MEKLCWINSAILVVLCLFAAGDNDIYLMGGLSMVTMWGVGASVIGEIKARQK